jgi:glycosyltransferase involved in cell wall biosynthesis
VVDELLQHKVEFTKLPAFDWRGPAAPIKDYLSIESSPDDVWFIGWAQSPLIEIIRHKEGRKYGLVVGLTKMNFDPLVFTGALKDLREKERLSIYDKIFANSRWCRECIARAYPQLAEKVAVTGFPFDFEIYQPYLDTVKEDDLIVFNQRFSLERLYMLEVETARILIQRGYRVKHLSGTPVSKLVQRAPALAPFLAAAETTGLEFVFNPVKEIYHKNLAKASVVVTTSIADMLPSSLIEAIVLGSVPVAPNSFCFPEFVHKDNLYTPYDLNEIIDIVEKKPQSSHSVCQYDKKTVVENFLREMGLA